MFNFCLVFVIIWYSKRCEKVTERVKKKLKKKNVVLKKWLTLHRFNKQMIVLQI